MEFLPWQGSTSGWGWTAHGCQPSCSQASKGQEKHVGGSPTPPNTPKVSLHQCKSPFVDTQLPHQTLHWPELLHTTLIPDFMGFWQWEKPNRPRGGCQGLLRHGGSRGIT